jgi:Fe2+ transport system protein FeoA
MDQIYDQENADGNLLSANPGEEIYLKGIEGKGLIGRLAALGLLPGIKLKMIRKRRHGPVLILVQKTRIALGRDIAQRVLIGREAT